jgi:hypothetical protein
MKRRAGIAQLVEQRTENPRARGSSPRPGIHSNLVYIRRLVSLFMSIDCFRHDSQISVAFIWKRR